MPEIAQAPPSRADLPASGSIATSLSPNQGNFSQNQALLRKGHLANLAHFPWKKMTIEQEQDQRQVNQAHKDILNALRSHKNINAQGVEEQLKRITGPDSIIQDLDLQESILKDILSRIERNGQCYQDDKNTCALADLEGALYTESPALLIKTSIDLIANGESTINGASIKLHPQALKMDDERTVMSRVLQESYAKFIVEKMTPGGHKYDSAKTTWDANVSGQIIHSTGFFGVQLNELKKLITGKESYYYTVDSINRSQMTSVAMSKMETAEIDPKYIKRDSEGNITVDPRGIEAATGGMMIMSKLSAGGQHSNHFMRAYKFKLGDETYILARNTIKGQENLIMTVDEFEQSLIHFYTDENVRGLANTASIEDVLRQVASGTSVENIIYIDGVPTFEATSVIPPETASIEFVPVIVKETEYKKYSFEEVDIALKSLRDERNIPMQGVYQMSPDDIIELHRILNEQRQQLDAKENDADYMVSRREKKVDTLEGPSSFGAKRRSPLGVKAMFDPETAA